MKNYFQKNETLFFNLEKQDSYADVDTLIGEIGKVP